MCVIMHQYVFPLENNNILLPCVVDLSSDTSIPTENENGHSSAFFVQRVSSPAKQSDNQFSDLCF